MRPYFNRQQFLKASLVLRLEQFDGIAAVGRGCPFRMTAARDEFTMILAQCTTFTNRKLLVIYNFLSHFLHYLRISISPISPLCPENLLCLLGISLNA